jgi:lipopolysaccharide assembly protein A
MTENANTTTGTRAEPGTRPEGERPQDRPRPAGAPPRTRVGAVWAGIIASAVVLIVLLTFIVQNGHPVEISFLGWVATLPTGVALLAAAVAGILIVAVPGASRMLQLRRAARKAR